MTKEQPIKTGGNRYHKPFYDIETDVILEFVEIHTEKIYEGKENE